MGKLAIRKIIYKGKQFFFESPVFKDGISIIEGENGHGKSTLMELIYYGLGGKVSAFENDSKSNEKHNEIYNDEENSIELHIDINNCSYRLNRFIGDNKIFIVDENDNVISTKINRNSHNDLIVFSDWILDKLDIKVFDIVQGIRSFKLNFTDLMRLIYHDQVTDIQKIYKNPDNSNFLTDSLEIRKAVFEVLSGESSSKYYSLLGEYKVELKKAEYAKEMLNNYNDFLNLIKEESLSNIGSIDNLISEKVMILNKIKIKYDLLGNDTSVKKSMEIEDTQKAKLLELEEQKELLVREKKMGNRVISQLIDLIDKEKRELREIQKIRLVNRKLNLFSPNTCPYCLMHVEREENKCICGNTVKEDQYEKFFYTDSDYMYLVNSHEKTIQSLQELLIKRQKQRENNASKIERVSNQITQQRKIICELKQDILYNQNFNERKMLLESRVEIENEIANLQRTKEFMEKNESLVREYEYHADEVKRLKEEVDICWSDFQKDMQKKVQRFSECYQDLMKLADEKCNDAYISEDYMPVVNGSEYRERSAQVPKRLMFFLTLLIESLKTSTNFPQLLLIDTPNKEGIDQKRLIQNLKLLLEAENVSLEEQKTYQIILTTGMGTYPNELKNNVVLSLDKNNYLLKRVNQDK